MMQANHDVEATYIQPMFAKFCLGISTHVMHGMCYFKSKSMALTHQTNMTVC